MRHQKAPNQHYHRAGGHQPLVSSEPADQQAGADAPTHQAHEQRPDVVTGSGGADATNGLVEARHEDHCREHRDTEHEYRRHADRVVAVPEQVQRDDRFLGLCLDEQEYGQDHQAERN